MKSTSYNSTLSILQLCVVLLSHILHAEGFLEGRTDERFMLEKYGGTEELDVFKQLIEVFGNVIDNHFPDCSLLVLTETEDVNINFFLGTLQLRNHPFVIVDNSLMKEVLKEPKTRHFLDYFLIGQKSRACRAVIIYLPNSSNSLSIRFLKKLHISEYPYIKVLAIGLPGLEQDFLLKHTLRNTIHSLYFALIFNSWHDTSLGDTQDNLLATPEQLGGFIKAYLHCLYCDAGKSQVVLTDMWSSKSGWKNEQNFFPDQFKNFNGYTLKMAVKIAIPFVEFIPDSNQPGTTVQFVDCLEVRMLREMSMKLNLTFVAFMSMDNEWGQPIGNGSWNGIVNTLMKERADFGMCLFPSAERYSVVDFTMMHAHEPFLIVTLKPQLLPKYLAIIKPFTTTMWIALVISGVVIGLSFWILQNGWVQISSMTMTLSNANKRFSITRSLFYTWGLLFQQTPFKHPSYSFGRLWLLCWMIFSLLILMSYKSALIASLSVPQRSEAIDSIQQLLGRTGWTWGMEPHYSVGWQFLTKSDNPNNQEITKTLGIQGIAEEMKLVSEGKHAFFTWKNIVRSFMAAEYTDRNGYTPMHISRKYYLDTNGAYWGCRKGAPFLRTIIDFKQHLVQGQFLEKWLDQMYKDIVLRARDKDGATEYIQEDGEQVILTLDHLQGAFYAFFIGQLLAGLVLMMECCQKRCFSRN